MTEQAENLEKQTKSALDLQGYSPLVQWMARHPRVTGMAYLGLGLLAAKVSLFDVIVTAHKSHVIMQIHHLRLGVICGFALIGFGVSVLIMGGQAVLFLRHRSGDSWIQKGQVVAFVLIVATLWASYHLTLLILRSCGYS